MNLTTGLISIEVWGCSFWVALISVDGIYFHSNCKSGDFYHIFLTFNSKNLFMIKINLSLSATSIELKFNRFLWNWGAFVFQLFKVFNRWVPPTSASLISPEHPSQRIMVKCRHVVPLSCVSRSFSSVGHTH